MNPLAGIERALIVKQPHISKILSGEKTLEMRSTSTNVRGRIALIEQGTGLIVGKCFLENSFEYFTFDLSKPKLRRMHCIDYEAHPEYKRYKHGWLLSDAEVIEPIPYTHPQGAVIWVKSEAWEN